MNDAEYDKMHSRFTRDYMNFKRRTDVKILSSYRCVNAKTYAKMGRKILTTGCFDLLHAGHLEHLEQCKTLGGMVFVCVGNDATVRTLKGEGRPINDERSRARLLAALECVDRVIISEESGYLDHTRLVELLRPDVYVVPASDPHLSEKMALVEANGGRVVTCDRTPPIHLPEGVSTTKIISQVLEAHAAPIPTFRQPELDRVIGAGR